MFIVVDDCERNDGTDAKPYFMSQELMHMIGERKNEQQVDEQQVAEQHNIEQKVDEQQPATSSLSTYKNRLAFPEESCRRSRYWMAFKSNLKFVQAYS